MFQILEDLPFEEKLPVRVNAKKYYYLIDPDQLALTVRELFDQQMGNAPNDFSTQAYEAYKMGAATAERSVRTILDRTGDLTQELSGVPFLQRSAFVKSRVFEEMKGFLGETATRLGRTLFEGLADGDSIQTIKTKIREDFSISDSRAETIARTEVIGSLRRGRIEQAEATAQQFGVEIGLMWFSALSPTTRQSHAERHGKVYSPDEVREFYSEDGNGINCKCTQVEVVMKDGKPLQEKLISREVGRRDTFLKKEEEE